MAKPHVNTNPVANQYTSPTERIVEFSDRALDGAGGLVSLRRTDRGRLQVAVYRCDAKVDVIVGHPDADDRSWDAHRTAVALAEEGIRRLLLFVDPDAEEAGDLDVVQSVIANLKSRVEDAMPTV